MSEVDPIDRPRAVREGEELELAALTSFLEEAIEELEPPLEVRQFPSGYSNLTYALRDARGQQFVLRRPPFGAAVKSGHDMHREYTVLERLHPVFHKVPRPFVYTDDSAIIGAPFYVMERVEGIILRGSDPGIVGLDETTMGAICRATIDALVDIHAVDVEAAGLRDFGRPHGYVSRQIEGWRRRYDKAATETIAAMDVVGQWLADHMPPDDDGALIHNDFKYDNVALDPNDPTQVLAVLDWEMATLGHPLMDLGTTLAYWVEPGDDPIFSAISGPTARPGNLSRREIVDYYAARSGRDVDAMLFHYVYGLYKVAVIGQQIYWRFEQGHTRDPRFAGLIHLVRAIAGRARDAIARETI